MRHFILVAVEHDDPAEADQRLARLRRCLHDGAELFDRGTGYLVLHGRRADLPQTDESTQLAAIYDRRARQATVDRRPHSRACGMFCRGHGPACSRDCPTCGGRAE